MYLGASACPLPLSFPHPVPHLLIKSCICKQAKYFVTEKTLTRTISSYFGGRRRSTGRRHRQTDRYPLLTSTLSVEYEDGNYSDAVFFIGQRGQKRGIVVQSQSVAEPDHIRAAQSHAGAEVVVGEQQFDNYQSKSNTSSLLTFRKYRFSFRSRDTFAATFNLQM